MNGGNWIRWAAAVALSAGLATGCASSEEAEPSSEGVDYGTGADTAIGPGSQASNAESGGQNTEGGGDWGEGDWGGGSADTSVGEGSSWGQDAEAGGETPSPEEPGNTQVNFGGAQDFGFVRALLDNNMVPELDQLDPAGFFAEHSTPLPDPVCGEQLCVQGMLGVLANLINGVNCTMLQVGLNSPLTVDENDRPPLNLAVVVDTSGSMSHEDKIAYVRDGLSKLINELNDDDKVSLVTYATEVSVPFAMDLVKGNRNELHEIASNLVATGGTNLYGGLAEGYQQAIDQYDSGRQNRVILLSDGNATIGITTISKIVEMSAGYNSDGIGLTTVGLGTDFHVELMQTLSEQADGNYYFLESAAAVDEVFTEELAYFTVPVGFDVSIEITTGDAYDFVAARGSHLFEPDEDGGRIEIPSVFLAHRLAHDDVTEDGGKRGGGSALLLELMPNEDFASQGPDAHVATIAFEFREPGTDEVIEQLDQIIYPYPSTELIATGYFDNDIVTKSFVMLNIYVGIEMACQLFHQGQSSEATGVLQLLIAAAADYEDSANAGEGDVDIQFDIELMQQLADVIEANTPSMPEPEVDIPDDPWPCD